MTNSSTSIVNFELEFFYVFFNKDSFMLHIECLMCSYNVSLFLVGLVVVIDEGLVVHDQHESTEGHVHPVH